MSASCDSRSDSHKSVFVIIANKNSFYNMMPFGITTSMYRLHFSFAFFFLPGSSLCDSFFS